MYYLRNTETLFAFTMDNQSDSLVPIVESVTTNKDYVAQIKNILQKQYGQDFQAKLQKLSLIKSKLVP